MIRTTIGSGIVIGLVLLAFMAGGGEPGVLVQPFNMLIVMLFAIGPSLAAGQLSVWREIFTDLRNRRAPVEAPADPAWARKRAVLTGAERGARLGGVVAAVLGVIHSLGSIWEPPEVLAHLIGGALVALCYGFMVSELVLAPIGLRALGDGARDERVHREVPD
jgi:flagellar motor component MotA